MMSLIKELSSFATEAAHRFNKITATEIAEPSVGSILSFDSALGFGIKSEVKFGVYLGNGEVIYWDGFTVSTSDVTDLLDSDDVKVFVACIDAYPVGFPSIAYRAQESLNGRGPAIKFKNSEAFVNACIDSDWDSNNTDKVSLIEKCERYLLVNSWGIWSQPLRYLKNTTYLSPADIRHIQQQIDEKEAFNSISNVWERSKRSITKTMDEYTGIMGEIKQELAFINEDYAEYRERSLQDNDKSFDYMSDLYEGIEQEVATLKALLQNVDVHN